MTEHSETVAGLAALTICESLLVTLQEKHILREDEVLALLRDAARAHERAALDDDKAELHRSVALLIDQIIAGTDSVRLR